MKAFNNSQYVNLICGTCWAWQVRALMFVTGITSEILCAMGDWRARCRRRPATRPPPGRGSSAGAAAAQGPAGAPAETSAASTWSSSKQVHRGCRPEIHARAFMRQDG